MTFVCVKGSWPRLSVDVILDENQPSIHIMICAMKEGRFGTPHSQRMLFCSREEMKAGLWCTFQ